MISKALSIGKNAHSIKMWVWPCHDNFSSNCIKSGSLYHLAGWKYRYYIFTKHIVHCNRKWSKRQEWQDSLPRNASVAYEKLRHVTTKKVSHQTHTHTHKDRCRIKLSLCATILCRQHKNTWSRWSKPAVASLWPMLALTEPMRSGSVRSLHKASFRADTSTGSPAWKRKMELVSKVTTNQDRWCRASPRKEGHL